MSAHDDLQDLLGAYVLDALDGEELLAVERHVATCPSCQEELWGGRLVAGVLGDVAEVAPAGLWERISSSLEEPPPPLRLVVADRPPGGAPSSRNGRGWRRPQTRIIAAFSAAALVIAALAVDVAHLDHRISSINHNNSKNGLIAAAQSAAARSDARHVSLHSSDDRFTLETAILPDGTGFVLHHNLPTLASSQTYQLWGLAGSNRISLGVLGDAPGISTFRVEGGLGGLAVTEEKAGGVPVTTKAPVVLALLPPGTGRA